jgi:hypothetical protein
MNKKKADWRMLIPPPGSITAEVRRVWAEQLARGEEAVYHQEDGGMLCLYPIKFGDTHEETVRKFGEFLDRHRPKELNYPRERKR